MKKVFFGTSNKHKLFEVREIFKDCFDIVSLNEVKLNIPEPDEPYETFLENASHKAKYYAKRSEMAVLCEDAGFCINSLNGFPGTRSKRFIEESGGLDNAFERIREKLQYKTDFSAEFVCVAVIFDPSGGQTFVGEGRVVGRVSFPARGDSGFDYDRIFVPNGYDKTFSELGSESKNKISHRKIAMEKLRNSLINLN